MKNILLLTILLVAFGCADEDLLTTPLTYDQFQSHLKAEMAYTSIVDFFGQPSKDIGSGIHIYVYELSDATEIWIGYTDEIHYAQHVDKDGQLLDTLL